MTVSRDRLLADPRSGATAGAARDPAITPRARRPVRTPPPRTARRGRPGSARTMPGRQPGEPFRYATPAPEPEPAPAAGPVPAPAVPEPRRFTFPVDSGNPSGAFLALFAWPLIFNLLRGGPARMAGWIRAKFINQPYGQDAAPGSAAPPPSGLPGNPPVSVPPHADGTCPPGYDRQSDGTCRLHSRLPL